MSRTGARLGDPCLPRPPATQIAAWLRGLMPSRSLHQREHLAAVIQASETSGTLDGYGEPGTCVAWCWAGGLLELEVERSTR